MLIRKKKIKKVRYRKVSLKLSEKQKKIIDRHCKVHKTTPNKLIKQSIKEYLLRNANSEEKNYYISENQLQLFDFDDNESTIAAEEEEEFNLENNDPE